MFCRVCRYNLSVTQEPRCPECGCSFDPARRHETTLPTASLLPWLWHHTERLLLEGWSPGWKRSSKFCRACFHDLRRVVENRCPVCETRFNHKDSLTFLRCNSVFTRIHERFRHICFWRGVLLPSLLLTIAMHAWITRTTVLPAVPFVGIRSYRLLTLYDWPAVMMGFGWFGAAFALHSHYFWSRIEPVWRFAGLGVVLGVLVLACGWGYALSVSISSSMMQ